MIRRLIVSLLCIALTSVIVVGTDEPANALGNERQFNMNGWPMLERRPERGHRPLCA